MNYPNFANSKNPTVIINEFRGINRLYLGAAGEGEYTDMSQEFYPAVSAAGLGEPKTIYIKGEEGAAALLPGKLACAYEVKEEDGKLYLTGVYDGDFYFEGQKIGYAARPGENFHIKPTDRIEIKKSAGRYIILAEGKNSHSSVWTYDTQGTSAGSEEARKNDGLLQSGIVQDMLPIENTLQKAYMYRLCTYIGTIKDMEEKTGKRYYMIFPNTGAVAASKYNFKKIQKGYDGYGQYEGMRGSVLYINPSPGEGNTWNSSKYCFDDFFEKNPVRFVIDAASSGKNGTLDILYEYESADFDLKDKSEYYGASVPYLPEGSIAIKDKTELLYTKIEYGDDGGFGYQEKVRLFPKQNPATSAADKAAAQGAMPWIIGHFERWNEEKKRYDFCEDDKMYGVCDSDGNELCIDSGGFYDSSTAVEVEFGLMTESARMNHIEIYQNRAWGTVADGSMLMYSELGQYTSFTSYQGLSTSSGFLQNSMPGKYSAVCAFSGALLTFKKDYISVYYGGENVSLSHEIKGVGCIDQRSIAEVLGNLIFLGDDGFYIYSGATPQNISKKLAVRYISAVAYADGTKYAACCEREDGKREILIYDLTLGGWTAFACEEAAAGHTESAFVLSGGYLAKIGEGSKAWSFETMDLFDDMTEDKGINEIYIRARLSGTMTVYTYADDKITAHKSFEDTGGKVKIFRVPVRLVHKNYYRIRACGSGRCVLYAIERTVYLGGKAR